MANTDLRLFNFYDQYIWQAADFANLQLWLYDFAAAIGEGLGGNAVLSGLGCQASGGLTVQVNPGLGFSTGGGDDSQGQICLLSNSGQVTVAGNNTNPLASLIVLRPIQVAETLIPEPLNPTNNVPLHSSLRCQLVVLAGTPAALPQYPATQAGDIIVTGVIVPAGASSITNSNLDRSPISSPRQKIQGIKSVSANYVASALEIGEDIIEADASALPASGLMISLPPAQSYAGRRKSIVNVGSSNPVSVSGNGMETIAGQSVQVLDDQWSALSVYSNGLGWRIV